jgi:hypothetical protein
MVQKSNENWLRRRSVLCRGCKSSRRLLLPVPAPTRRDLPMPAVSKSESMTVRPRPARALRCIATGLITSDPQCTRANGCYSGSPIILSASPAARRKSGITTRLRSPSAAKSARTVPRRLAFAPTMARAGEDGLAELPGPANGRWIEVLSLYSTV